MASPVQIGEWILSAKRQATTISPARCTVYSFDLEGRPLSWFDRDRVYKRSLASELFGRERAGGRKRYWRLSADETAERFRGMLDAVARAPRPADPELEGRLERILGWSAEQLLDERERFAAVYRPISILPPDQYLSVALQATFGCTWNRCTFCSFYQDRPFSVRSPEEFRAHVRGVRELLGEGAGLRKRIFLADGNALTLADRRLRAIFEISRAVFPDRGLYGFVDLLTGERRGVDGWAELRDGGLRRVYIGVETGDDHLLDWLNKPGSADAAAAFVEDLKRAGLRVSVILMVGVGGQRFAADHVRGSLGLVARLPLDRRDVVYLSPFVVPPGSAYARRARAEGVRPLEPGEIERQYAELRDGIRSRRAPMRISRYDIREFIY